MSVQTQNASIIGRSKWEADTPALFLDLAAVQSNIARMSEWFRDKECNLRPHFKTHKLPLIARMQIEAGAMGITCAKLSEAQILLEHGVQDVLVANQIIGPVKIQRLIGLAECGRMMVCVDDAANADELSAAAAKRGLCLDVLMEVNVGLDRCGVAAGEQALKLAQGITKLPGLNFRGLMGYEGGMYLKNQKQKEAACRKANQTLVDTKRLLVENGIQVEIVSAGGSNTYQLTGTYPGITELQVGSYVTMDTHNQEYGLGFEPALRVLATVISRPEPGRAVIDAGLKAVSKDEGLPACTLQGVELIKLNEEHGHLRIHDPDQHLKPGDKIELIPSHGCTTIPLHADYILVRDQKIVSITPIAARGALT